MMDCFLLFLLFSTKCSDSLLMRLQTAFPLQGQNFLSVMGAVTELDLADTTPSRVLDKRITWVGGGLSWEREEAEPELEGKKLCASVHTWPRDMVLERQQQPWWQHHCSPVYGSQVRKCSFSSHPPNLGWSSLGKREKMGVWEQTHLTLPPDRHQSSVLFCFWDWNLKIGLNI